MNLGVQFIGKQGIGYNQVSPADAANLVNFLRRLRDNFGSERIIHLSIPTNG